MYLYYSSEYKRTIEVKILGFTLSIEYSLLKIMELPTDSWLKESCY